MSRVFKSTRVTFKEGETVKIDGNRKPTSKNASNDIGENATGTKEETTEEGTKKHEELLASAEKKSSGILETAHSEADSILEAARMEAETIKAEAEIEGRQVGEEEGYTTGLEQGQREAEAIKAEAETVLETAKSERNQMLEGVEEEVLHLITDITEKLTGGIATLHPELINVLIQAGFADATLHGKATVYVSETEYETVLDSKEELIDSVKGLNDLEIMRDSSLKKMDCIIETAYGNIDCSLGEQFSELKKNLFLLYEND